MLEGAVDYRLEAVPEDSVIVEAGGMVVIEPTVPHRVRFVRPGRMFVELHRSQGSGAPVPAVGPPESAQP